MNDQSYLHQPKFLSKELSKIIVEKVRNHCRQHLHDSFEFVFHGGEPLLANPKFYQDFVEIANQALLPEIKPIFYLQTNGVLLNQNWGKLFEKLNIYVGISLDGTKEANDRHRLTHSRQSSYLQVMAGIDVIRQFSKLNKTMGFLSVIDIESDPHEVYHHFIKIGKYLLNFLFPLGNFNHPPAGINPFQTNRSTPYADWLIEIFELWTQSPKPKPRIRLFELIIELLLGIDKGVEVLGQRHIEILSIETDGVVEVDSAIRVTDLNFESKKNIKDYEIDDILKDDLSILFSKSHKKVSKVCKRCPLLQVCGGGYILNRFEQKNKFNNPSVYCQDLMKLIIRVHNYLRETSSEYQNQTDNLSFEKVRDFVYKL